MVRKQQPVNYPIKLKAAILERNNEPLVVDQVTFEGPLLPGQVLVQIHYSGICGKQMEEIRGSGGPDAFLPHMLGHEGSGVIIDVGPGVKKVSKEDHVVLHWLKGTGIDAEPPLYVRNGERVNAGWVTTFNEYGVVAENRVTRIPPDSDMEIACLLGCVVTTGVGVILNEANVCPGESVAVFGCGGVGLNAIQGAALVRAFPIIAVDKNYRNLDLARQFGATHTINSIETDVLAENYRITDDKGAHTVIIAASDPNAIELGVKVSSVPGNVFLAGVPPRGTNISVDALSIHNKRMIVGSHGGGSFPDRDVPRYLELYVRGYLKLKELISKRVSLDQINTGIDSLRSGIGGRCIVKMIDNEN
ncbi:MAG: zinc-binding dehydrogenase [Chloroflexi bacterium]|nr:zinc-binding dehydrogenase [Chloroflexota bacterium]